MADRYANLRGTVDPLFRLGIGGAQLRTSGGAVEARDATDAGYAVARGADPVGDDDLVTRRYFIDEHKALRDLIHFIDQGPADGFASGSYKETTYSGPFILTATWYESATKAKKLVDLIISYSGAFPTSEVWRLYDTDGSTVLVTLTDSIVYDGPFEQSRTRTWA